MSTVNTPGPLVGPASELAAAHRLTTLGFRVFLPAGHNQGPVDLVFLSNEGDCYRAQVKTLSKDADTGRVFVRTRREQYGEYDFDFLLAVSPVNNQVWCVPWSQAKQYSDMNVEALEEWPL